jgi:hypothetical protein
MGRLEDIREEAEETRNSKWLGDYPRDDILFLLAYIDELMERLRKRHPAEEGRLIGRHLNGQ